MNGTAEVEIIVRHPDMVGESPCYDGAHRRLLWVDIHGQKLHALAIGSDGNWTERRTWQLDGMPCAVMPRTNGGVLVALDTDLVVLDEIGESMLFASLPSEYHAVRFNDATCDSMGRVFAGWVAAEDASTPGGLVRFDPDGSIESLLTNVGLPNGLGWSPDSETFYFTDTLARRIDAFDFDVAEGRLSGRRGFLKIEDGSGAPDGMAVDSDGYVWVAIPYSGQVRRYSPKGELVNAIDLPTPMPTSCAFAGPDGSELFITSLSIDLPTEFSSQLGLMSDRLAAAAHNDMGGALLLCRPGASGLPANEFAG